ncbi:conserved hypothetical protein [Mycolicibacter sinensis]|uniref:Uncharacterized protein n=1 Tax=Mycolicibacter sinensis (strain JDM601) TaxID=875328 RepID=F5Z0R8_MYCSD|nr:conserved hypothetical protein [Mycolicibacter sinensis]
MLDLLGALRRANGRHGYSFWSRSSGASRICQTPRRIHWCVNATLAQHIRPGPLVFVAKFGKTVRSLCEVCEESLGGPVVVAVE